MNTLTLEEVKPPPKNIDEAIVTINDYIKTQLPEVLEVEFTPICFDISHDQKKLIIGGQYGNLAIFDLVSSKMVKDIELVSHSITSVLFALDDSVVIAASENNTIFFLDFPSFNLRNSLSIPGEKILIKVGHPNDCIYISNKTTEIKIFYIETNAEQMIEAEQVVTYFDICNGGNMIAFALANGSIKLFHNSTDSSLQCTTEHPGTVEIMKFSQNIKLIAAGFSDFIVKV